MEDGGAPVFWNEWWRADSGSVSLYWQTDDGESEARTLKITKKQIEA